MIKIRLYSRIRIRNNNLDDFYDDYSYNYVLFIYLEDEVYYNIISDIPVFLKKKISRWGFEYIKEFLHLSLTTRNERDIIKNMTSKDSKWVKIIDIKY